MAGGGGGCGNETAAHHSILWAGGIPSVWMASLLFCCLVLFTTVWEYLTELLEHRVAGHHGYQELLEKVYKEREDMNCLQARAEVSSVRVSGLETRPNDAKRAV